MKAPLNSYPDGRLERDKWVVELRGARNPVDPATPYAFFVEDECAKSGEVVPVATIFLTNRECPWRCVMCDLWKNTLAQAVPAGAIPAQIDFALRRLPAARQVKLYNSGSFFDLQAIPLGDYRSIADRVDSFERVIVESHPLLVGSNCFQFAELIDGRLEVAMGLETADPKALERLNKGVDLKQFAVAAEELRRRQIDLRVFVLVKPPFTDEAEALFWAERSIDFAFDCGATAVSLLPTRGGNGAMEALSQSGRFSPPRLKTLEAASEYGLSLKRGRVFADVWELTQFGLCPSCSESRVFRLRTMNLTQALLAPVLCGNCGAEP